MSFDSILEYNGFKWTNDSIRCKSNRSNRFNEILAETRKRKATMITNKPKGGNKNNESLEMSTKPSADI